MQIIKQCKYKWTSHTITMEINQQKWPFWVCCCRMWQVNADIHLPHTVACGCKCQWVTQHMQSADVYLTIRLNIWTHCWFRILWHDASLKVLEFFNTGSPGLVLLLLLFLKMTVGLHCPLSLFLHHSLSGHGGLACGGHGVAEERVEKQLLGFLLVDRSRGENIQ